MSHETKCIDQKRPAYPLALNYQFFNNPIYNMNFQDNCEKLYRIFEVDENSRVKFSGFISQENGEYIFLSYLLINYHPN